MPFTYCWSVEDAEAASGFAERCAVYNSLESAKNQAAYDASVPGGPDPRHITDQDGVILCAYGKVEEFIPVVASGGGLESQDAKPLDEREADEDGVIVVTQTELTGDDFTAYVESVDA